MKITQHIPAYVSGYSPETIAFNTLEELTEIPFVKQWSETKPHIQKLKGLKFENGEAIEFEEHIERTDSFSYFALHNNALMAVLNNGSKWYVVGFIDDISTLNLPPWISTKII